jgi:hypothetical protein
VPDHLQPTAEDKAEMMSAEMNVGDRIPKSMLKLTRIFDQRRYLVGHIFYTPDHSNWHFIYFDQRDIAKRSNHWEAGSHIHVINWLTNSTGAQAVWGEFNSGNPQVRNSFHIRWADDIERHSGPYGS